MNAQVTVMPDWLDPAKAGLPINSEHFTYDDLLLGYRHLIAFVQREVIEKQGEPNEFEGRPVLSVPRFADRYGITRITVYAWLRKGVLPADCVLRPTSRRTLIDLRKAEAALEIYRARPKRTDVCKRAAEEVDPLDCEPSTATATARRTPTTKAAAPAKRRASRAA